MQTRGYLGPILNKAVGMPVIETPQSIGFIGLERASKVEHPTLSLRRLALGQLALHSKDYEGQRGTNLVLDRHWWLRLYVMRDENDRRGNRTPLYLDVYASEQNPTNCLIEEERLTVNMRRITHHDRDWDTSKDRLLETSEIYGLHTDLVLAIAAQAARAGRVDQK